MPFIRTTTTEHITPEKEIMLKEDFGKAISLVSGKAECYLMLDFRGDAMMAYQGDNKTPLAMVEVQLLGESDPKELDMLTAALTDSLNRILGIDPLRIYINHSFYTYWGVGGHNV